MVHLMHGALKVRCARNDYESCVPTYKRLQLLIILDLLKTHIEASCQRNHVMHNAQHVLNFESVVHSKFLSWLVKESQSQSVLTFFFYISNSCRPCFQSWLRHWMLLLLLILCWNCDNENKSWKSQWPMSQLKITQSPIDDFATNWILKICQQFKDLTLQPSDQTIQQIHLPIEWLHYWVCFALSLP